MLHQYIQVDIPIQYPNALLPISLQVTSTSTENEFFRKEKRTEIKMGVRRYIRNVNRSLVTKLVNHQLWPRDNRKCNRSPHQPLTVS